jgi:hypothetical protein
MASALGPNGTTEGLAMMYDAGNTKSYPGGTLVWTDLINGYKKTNGDDTRLFLNNGAQLDNESGGNLVFNGSDMWANHGAGLGNVVNLGSAGTINVWFKQTAATLNKGLVSIGNTVFYIGGTTTTLLAIWDGNVGYFNGQIIPDDRKTLWNMATYTWYGQNVATYLNGAGPDNGTLPNITTSGLVYVGVYGNLSFSSYFNGKITNISVYNRVLSSQEVAANYTAMRKRHNV